jgi:[ribosomal protein S18]-alanine N-acetyltransferase
MVIRNMTEADLPEVCAIENDTFSEPWSKEDFLSSMKEKNNGYLVAEIDGKVVGYCGYWGIAGEGYIYNVAVKNEFRNQKIGYIMLNTLLKDSKNRGISSFTLEVRITNQAAIRLYKALGFERAGIRRDFYSKPKEDAVIMWLKTIQ